MKKQSLFTVLLFISSALFNISKAEIHTIDLLVLHPPKSVLNTDFVTRVASMESYANKALENSQSNLRFRVIQLAEINIPNPKTDGATLSKLVKNTRAQELRTKYGADLVTMITPTGPYCGVGYLIGGNNDTIYSGSKAYGFNVVADRCVTAFAHELGHNLGLGHSAKQNSRGGLYSWGRGHGVDRQFVTTMAYGSAYQAPRVQFFSNPEVKTCKNQQCGVEINRSNAAHAVKAIGVSGPQIAAWYDSVDPVKTNQPPHANEDFAVSQQNKPVTIDVLNNDVDPESDTLILSSVDAAKHGQTKIQAGEIIYTPNAGFIGQDNFQYHIADSHGNKAQGKVTVNIGWGTHYQYFQGRWTQLPDFTKLTAVDSGIAHNFTLQPRLRDENYGFRYSAQLEVPVSGNYRFFLTSDDGSRLTIDNQQIINNDGTHTAQTKSTSVNLQSGLHSIEVDYFQATDKHTLILEWQIPGQSREQISSSALRLAKPQNSYPVAKNDTVSMAQDSEISIDVLKNDSDADNDKLSIVSFTEASNGSVSLLNQQFIYQPAPGFTGSDAFSYQISDGRGGEDSAEVKISVGLGVAYQYYEGNWNRLPDFSLLTPASEGTQKVFNLRNRKRNNYFAFRFHSVLNVPEDGDYSFYLRSDDGSKLFIDGKLVINNDGLHSARWRANRIPLTAGAHNIEVQYFEKTGRQRLALYWKGPEIGFSKLTEDYLSLPE